MKFIIAEKPNVARLIKDVLAPDARAIVYKKTKFNTITYYENKNFLICNTVGHIIGIKSPEKINPSNKWNIDAVPFQFPNDIPTEVIDKDLFSCISSCIKKYDFDEYIVATDGDREGQNIWRKIRKHLTGYKPKKESRLWISEWTKEGVEDAYKNRFDNKLKENLGLAAQCREESDYRWGMTGTVATTKAYASGFGNVCSIGRVMTPTSKFVRDRELKIINFVPEKYNVISLETETDEKNKTLILKHSTKERLDKKKSKEIYDLVTSHIKKEGKVKLSVEKSIVKKKCPELYDGTSILQDMNVRYGLNAMTTSAIIQKLYQNYVLITYPGTNDTVISEGTAKMAKKAFANLKGYYDDEIKEIEDHKWNVSSHLITTEDLAHEAITPVFGKTNTSNIAKLTTDERNVYFAIVERFLAAFYPQLEIEETKVSTKIDKETFTTKGSKVVEEGWRKVITCSIGSVIPKVTDNCNYKIVDIKKEEKETVPPSRYTEATLIEDMKNPLRFVEDKDNKTILKKIEGLGTSRTRPSIIDNIIKKGYFEIKSKTIYPTQKCMDLFDILPEDLAITSPAMTAEFEQKFIDIENGKISRDACNKSINNDIIAFCDFVKKDKRNLKISNTIDNTTNRQISKSKTKSKVSSKNTVKKKEAMKPNAVNRKPRTKPNFNKS